MSKMIWVAAFGLALAGCASAPPSVRTTGAAMRLSVPTTFDIRLTEPVTDEETAAARTVTERLTARGWTTDAARPEVLVEVAFVTAPQALGVHADDARPDAADSWLEPPTPRRWWRRAGERHTLNVRFLDPATGRTVTTSTATVLTGSGKAAPVAELAGALSDAWSAPAGTESVSSQAAGSSTPKAEPSVPAS